MLVDRNPATGTLGDSCSIICSAGGGLAVGLVIATITTCDAIQNL